MIGDMVPWSRRRSSLSRRGEDSSVLNLRNQMDALFESVLGGDWNISPLFEGSAGFVPKVDLSENDNALVVKAELPGLTDKDVELTLHKDSLVLRGEKKNEREEKEEGYHYVERSFGSFQRVIPLHVAVDEDKVEAVFKNGVMTITLPKAMEEKKKSRKISVRS